MAPSAEDARQKCVFLGDSCVGKTSLIIRASTHVFPEIYTPTLFDDHVCQVATSLGRVNLVLWDTIGAWEHDRLRPLVYTMTDVCVFCYAVNMPDSFANVQQRWLPEVERYVPGIPKVLVACKADIYQEEQDKKGFVGRSSGKTKARAIGAVFVETSALAGVGVDELLRNAAERAVMPASGKGRMKEGSGCVVF